MPRETPRQKLLTRRAAILAGGQVALIATLTGRLYQLQVFERDRYRVMADENRINLRLLVPPRGRIVDRFGIALADNRQNYRVVIVPEQTSDINATLDAIATLIDVGDADLLEQFFLVANLQRLTAFSDADPWRVEIKRTPV